MLNKLSEKFDIKESGGLYRDDGMVAIKGSKRVIENTKRIIIEVFKTEGLRIDEDIICSRTTDYLDTTLSLEDGTHRPYTKPNKSIKYISVESNHPPEIIKNLPKMIAKRISMLSSNQKIFEDAIEPFERALKESGYNDTLAYEQKTVKKTRCRTRDVCGYNPPFSMNVRTRIGGTVFYLLSKYFPPGSKYHHVFNKATVKISYCCLPNMDTIIKGFNKKVLSNTDSKNENARYDIKNCNTQGVCEKGAVPKVIVRPAALYTKQRYM